MLQKGPAEKELKYQKCAREVQNGTINKIAPFL